MAPIENFHTQRPGDHDIKDSGSHNNGGIQDFLREMYAIPDRFRSADRFRSKEKAQLALFDTVVDKTRAQIPAVGNYSFVGDVVGQSGQIAQGIVDGTRSVVSGAADLSSMIGKTILEGALAPGKTGELRPILLLIRGKPDLTPACVGEQTGRTIVGAVRTIDDAGKRWNQGWQYARDTVAGKVHPVHDLSAAAHHMEHRWESLPTREKAAVATEVVLSLVLMERVSAVAGSLVAAPRTGTIEKMRELCTRIDRRFADVDATIARYNGAGDAASHTLPVGRRTCRISDGEGEASINSRVRHARADEPDKPIENGQERIRKPEDSARNVESQPLKEAAHEARLHMLEVRGPVARWHEQAVCRAMDALPDKDILAVREGNYKVYIVNQLKDAKDRFPQDIDEKLFLLSTEHAQAITIPETQSMIFPQVYRDGTTRKFVTQTAAKMENNTRHEFGHALADVFGWEKDVELQTIYENIARKLLRELRSTEPDDLLAIRSLIKYPSDDKFHEILAELYAISSRRQPKS